MDRKPPARLVLEPLGRDLNLDNDEDVDWLMRWAKIADQKIREQEREINELRSELQEKQTKKDMIEWLSDQDLGPYKGQWIVVHNYRVVGHNAVLKTALEIANLPKGADPFVLFIPEREWTGP